MFIPFGAQPRDSWWGQQIYSSCASSRSWSSTNWCTCSPANYLYVRCSNFSSSTSNNPPSFSSLKLSSLILFMVANIVLLSHIKRTVHVCMIQQWFKRERACPSSLCKLSLLELQRLLMLLVKRQRPSWISSLGEVQLTTMELIMEI